DGNGIRHERFSDFAGFLEPGDLVVVNTSATLAAEVDGTRADGSRVVVHFSTRLDDGSWVVELRPPWPADRPVRHVHPGDLVELPDGVRVLFHATHPGDQRRLWRATVDVDGGLVRYLARHGRPIRYTYVPRPHRLADYQTVFATEPGSAEMPSAGRPFTTRIVTDMVVRGVTVAPITLHT